MSNCGAPGQPHAELFAFENSGRVILDPFADHDFAADVHKIEHPADRVAGGGVGFFFFAAAEPGEGVQRGGFGRPNEIEFDDALDVVVVRVRFTGNAHRLTAFAKQGTGRLTLKRRAELGILGTRRS